MMNTEDLDLDFSKIEDKAGQAAKVVQEQKDNPSSSTKPLKFEITAEDSPIKRTILTLINESDKNYSDLINYFNNSPILVKPEKDAKKKKGKYEPSESAIAFARARKGGNVIIGLRKRPTMYDSTLFALADFLNKDIAFIDRDNPDDIRRVE